MNNFERRVRAAIFQSLHDSGRAPSAREVAAALDATEAETTAALHALHDAHRLVLVPDSTDLWMAHPFSGVPTDFVVHAGARQWFANCVWDGLAILGFAGDGRLDTHSPQSKAPISFEVRNGRVSGDGIVHFLVPARSFWDNIGFT